MAGPGLPRTPPSSIPRRQRMLRCGRASNYGRWCSIGNKLSLPPLLELRNWARASAVSRLMAFAAHGRRQYEPSVTGE